VASYFAPDSAVRRICREPALVLGGGRALLLQAAHPLVAAGVLAHSRYDENPWARLERTMRALDAIIYGSREEADRAASAVRHVHEGVRGRIVEPMGPFPAGTAYSALDPDLLIWVHTSLVDTILVTYEALVRPLDREDAEAFHRDMRTVGGLFGIPDGALPETLRELRADQAGRMRSGAIVVTPAARELAAAILRPPAPARLRPLFRGVAAVTVALLPSQLRAQYGLRWSRGRERVFDVASRPARRAIPPTVRLLWRRVVGPSAGAAPRPRVSPAR